MTPSHDKDIYNIKNKIAKWPRLVTLNAAVVYSTIYSDLYGCCFKLQVPTAIPTVYKKNNKMQKKRDKTHLIRDRVERWCGSERLLMEYEQQLPCSLLPDGCSTLTIESLGINSSRSETRGDKVKLCSKTFQSTPSQEATKRHNWTMKGRSKVASWAWERQCSRRRTSTT